MIAEMEAVKTLDCRQQFCPGPVLRAKEAIDILAPGQVLEILATDQAAESDIPSWAKWAGHQLLLVERQDGTLRFLVRKGE